MPWFRVFLRGENFLLDRDGEQACLGFYTTRFVETDDEDKAELAAVDLIRQDSFLRTNVKNPLDDPPMIYAEEIDEVEPRKAGDQGVGYTFFSE